MLGAVVTATSGATETATGKPVPKAMPEVVKAAEKPAAVTGSVNMQKPAAATATAAAAAGSSATSTPGSATLHVPKPRPFVRCRQETVYERISKVGEGTFGEVFKARCRADPTKIVALKKVLMKNEREGFPITALREIKILKSLNHPNVLKLEEIVHSQPTEFNRQKGSIFLVFEFMEHDLGGLLNRPVEFYTDEIMCLTKQLLTGLHYIHVQKILHRDMKVANLLLNDAGVLKIADFGLARGYDKNNSRYTSTVCTRWYRPPEVLLGQRNYTTAIDVWGVGCIVAELFVGRPILQGGKQDAKDESENDLDQYMEICKLCGTPSADNWDGFDDLPVNAGKGAFMTPKEVKMPSFKQRFQNKVRGCKSAIGFIEHLLTLDPKKRPSANDALDHPFLWGNDGKDPMPCKPDRIRKFPSSHELTVQRPPREWTVQVKSTAAGHPKADRPRASHAGQGHAVGATRGAERGGTSYARGHHRPEQVHQKAANPAWGAQGNRRPGPGGTAPGGVGAPRRGSIWAQKGTAGGPRKEERRSSIWATKGAKTNNGVPGQSGLARAADQPRRASVWATGQAGSNADRGAAPKRASVWATGAATAQPQAGGADRSGETGWGAKRKLPDHHPPSGGAHNVKRPR